ncbi:UNVERIFIED_CONTAM: hypothetical protein GTU68_030600 [Idotea baltica]|nr:hypothetical protein [Idotea baltica]
MLYDGHPALEKGAVVCRVAPSFIRFGNFQLFSARKDVDSLRSLADYTIKYYYPEINETGKDKYLAFYKSVVYRTIDMIIEWQRVGFVHGVMNTDNMSILGLTIDYGPYGWLEGYDPGWTPNTTDRQGRRYRFGYQPNIAYWNLMQLGNSLYPLIEDVEPLEDILNSYANIFAPKYLEMMKSKIGLFEEDDNDQQLIDDLEKMLTFTETDMTIFFRKLSEFNANSNIDLKGNYLEFISDAFYDDWFEAYKARLTKEKESPSVRKIRMNNVNPKYVLRNYMAQLAIDAADEGDYSIVGELYELLKQPYDDQLGSEKWFSKRPEWARNKVGCSMLSCSS